ncbi:hypothetical protein MTR67_047641 [Solanum verrucosum]|jgi:hypothetical protein
MKYL